VAAGVSLIGAHITTQFNFKFTCILPDRLESVWRLLSLAVLVSGTLVYNILI
jgi:hypothetical protein